MTFTKLRRSQKTYLEEKNYNSSDHFYTMIDSLEGIGVMHPPGLPEVIYQILALLSPPVSVEGFPSEGAGDLLHLLVLKCLPEIVR